jgi:hypothetical protein
METASWPASRSASIGAVDLAQIRRAHHRQQHRIAQGWFGRQIISQKERTFGGFTAH